MTTAPTFTRTDPDTRRLSLIQATTRVLARDGASGASVRAIAADKVWGEKVDFAS